VICPVSYIELAPAFSGDSSLQEAFLQEAGVDWLQPWTLLDIAASYQLWANHISKSGRAVAASALSYIQRDGVLPTRSRC